jgi:hypothetical protein
MATSRWRTNGHQQGDLMAAAGEIQMAIDIIAADTIGQLLNACAIRMIKTSG